MNSVQYECFMSIHLELMFLFPYELRAAAAAVFAEQLFVNRVKKLLWTEHVSAEQE